MKKAMLVLSVLFAALTVAGIIYVLIDPEKHKAYYAIVPMVFAIATILSCKKVK